MMLWSIVVKQHVGGFFDGNFHLKIQSFVYVLAYLLLFFFFEMQILQYVPFLLETCNDENSDVRQVTLNSCCICVITRVAFSTMI